MNYNDWLDKLKEYWLNKEVSKIVGELFATNVIYYETPFDKVDDITTVWNDILEQNIISLEYRGKKIEIDILEEEKILLDLALGR